MTDFEQMSKEFTDNFVATRLQFESETTNVNFNHNGKLMVGCSEGGEVKLFDVEDNYNVLKTYQHPADPDLKEELHITRYARFSPDGTFIAVASKVHLVVLSVDTFQPVFTLSDLEMVPANKDNIRMFCGVSFSSEGDYMAVGMKNRVDVFDVRNDFSLVSTYEAKDKISQILFYNDKLIFGGFYGVIQTVDRATKQVMAEYNFKEKEQDHLRDMSITPNGFLFLCLYALGPQVLNPDSLEVVSKMDIPYPVFFAHKHLNKDITVTSGGIRAYQQWNMNTYKPIDKFEHYEDGYHASQTDGFFRDFSPDNRVIALCAEKEIRILYTPVVAISKLTSKLGDETATLMDTDPDFQDVQINEDVLYAMAGTMV